MASCPECCKLQRWKARKQGRLPAAVHKTCQRCGVEFQVTGSAITHRVFCEACSGPARAERRKQYAEDRKGECVHRKRMCRTVASAMIDMQSAIRAQHAASLACGRTLTNPPRICRHCSRPFVGDARRTSTCCSRECAVAWLKVIPCVQCGDAVAVRKVGRDAIRRAHRPMCRRCMTKAWRRTPRGRMAQRLRDRHGEHRKRCRRHGVPYDASVKPHLVFERDKFRCHVCKRKTLLKFKWIDGKPADLSPTIDHHPYPLSAGVCGHEWHNVRCCCWRCNTRKGAKWDKQRPLTICK